MGKLINYFKTPKHVQKLIKKTKGGSWKALSEIYQRHNYQITAVAKSYQGRGISHGGLIRLGNIGLMRAIFNWKKENQCPFNSYTQIFIRESMLQGLAR
ncbi:hypothetical protein E3V55_03630 [Candidatus Marinimicrobia bacterium MT.SAG.3]|nr:hypothetical protein E3V55_03630 [Candidatus Marinimicrobia bacterium MT.SAG.3]